MQLPWPNFRTIGHFEAKSMIGICWLTLGVIVGILKFQIGANLGMILSILYNTLAFSFKPQ